MKRFRLLVSIGAVGLMTVATASTILLGMGEAATAQAQNIENRLRGAGIRLTPQDVKAIKSIELHRKRFMEMYRQLDAYEDAYAAKGSTRVKNIQGHKKAMRLIQRQLPSADATVGGYYLEVQRYLKGPSAAHAKKMREVEASMKVYATEVTAKTGVAAIPEPKAKPKASRFDDYVVYVMSLNGQSSLEWYINGVKVTRARQVIDMKGNRVITLRAMATGARRKQSRNFQPTGSAELLENTDYRLKYQVKNSNFSAMTDWFVERETYRWNWIKQPNTNASFKTMSSSFNSALENDVMAFKCNGNFTVNIKATGDVDWKGISKRAGGTREMSNSEKGGATIVFNVGPR